MPPRTYAKVKLSIWNDRDWTQALSLPAQAMYETFLTDGGLSQAGVTDWRPNRIAKRSRGTTPNIVRALCHELQDGPDADGSGPLRFIIVDEDTEEVLVRSFIRHDGILRSPNMTVAMCNAHGRIASPLLREWVEWEAWRAVREGDPEEVNPVAAATIRERLREPVGNPSDPVPIQFDPGFDPVRDWFLRGIPA